MGSGTGDSEKRRHQRTPKGDACTFSRLNFQIIPASLAEIGQKWTKTQQTIGVTFGVTLGEGPKVTFCHFLSHFHFLRVRRGSKVFKGRQKTIN